MQALSSSATHRRLTVANRISALSAIIAVAIHLARRLTERVSRQLRSTGPKRG